MSDPIVIVAARRTPIGGMSGQFVSLTSPQLASAAIAAVVKDAGLKGEDISEAIIGCVLPAAVGQAPARQAVLGAGLPGGRDRVWMGMQSGSRANCPSVSPAP